MLAFVTEQLGVPATAFATMPGATKLAASMAPICGPPLGLRSFRLADWRSCLHAGTDAAWATDRGEPIVQAVLAYLRSAGVLALDALLVPDPELRRSRFTWLRDIPESPAPANPRADAPDGDLGGPGHRSAGPPDGRNTEHVERYNNQRKIGNPE